MVGVYVDDLLIVGPVDNDIIKFKQEMQEKFWMSDLGQLSYYLGIAFHVWFGRFVTLVLGGMVDGGEMPTCMTLEAINLCFHVPV